MFSVLTGKRDRNKLKGVGYEKNSINHMCFNAWSIVCKGKSASA